VIPASVVLFFEATGRDPSSLLNMFKNVLDKPLKAGVSCQS